MTNERPDAVVSAPRRVPSAPKALLALTIAAACLLPMRASRAAGLPPGFTQTLLVNGISKPTYMAFAPDGRLFVCEQGGQLRVIKNGRLNSTPFVSLTVDSAGERGLLGVAFDPDFDTDHFVYVYYTATTPTTHNRISRFTANGDVAVPGSETPLFDLDDLSSATNHNGGGMHFGPDGKLYVGVGENNTPSNAQSFSNVLGKLLRLNRDGTIPADNPFVNETTGKVGAIYALGLRNPYSFAFQPTTGLLLICDVGKDTWEEIDVGTAGANYGWPDTEGYTSDPRYQSPVYEYGHGSSEDTGCAIIGGDFYNPVQPRFPSQYDGVYFFADYCSGWIHAIDPAHNYAVMPFADGISQPVALRVGDDGALYCLSKGDGAVYVIQYAPVLAPTADAYVKSGAPTTNFGGQAELIVKRGANAPGNALNRVSYLRFDLRGVTTAPSSAILQLSVGSTSNPAGATVPLSLYAVPNTGWTESNLTWNSAPGLDRATVTSTGRLVRTFPVVLQPGPVRVDITAYVRDHLGAVVTLQLIDNNEDNAFLSLVSRENSQAGPLLILSY